MHEQAKVFTLGTILWAHYLELPFQTNIYHNNLG